MGPAKSAIALGEKRAEKAGGGRSIVGSAFIILAVFVTLIVGSEQVIEYKDARKYSSKDTFAATADNLLVRYDRRGEEHSRPVVIFISGLGYSLEESQVLQVELSKEVATVSYDRGGRGFSRSYASSAAQQANELAGLLDAIGLDSPVVLVGYSTGGMIARVFASRFPNKTAGLFLIEPTFPEMDVAFPDRHGPIRRYAKWMITATVESSFGIMRLKSYLGNSSGDQTEADRKIAAILARSWHNFAIAREWLFSGVSARETLGATIAPTVPVEIAMNQTGGDAESEMAKFFYSTFVSIQRCGNLRELPAVDHKELMRAGPALEILVASIASFARNAEKCRAQTQ